MPAPTTNTQLFSNNATTTLSGSITSTATTLNVQSGGGALFPNPSAGQFFVLTIVDAATGLLNEILWCTARSGDAFTVVRAQEGTTGLAWNSGDIVSMFVTAGSMQQMLQYGAIPPASLVHYGVAAGSANAITCSTTPTFTAVSDGILVEVNPILDNTGATTFNPNGIGAASVKNRDGTALASGALVAGQPFQIMYLGGNWILMTTAASSAPTQNSLVHYGTATGTNTMTTTVAPAISSYSDGLLLEITPAASNTGAASINANGVGFASIVYPNGSALGSGVIVANQPFMIMYLTAAGGFVLMNAPPPAGGPGVGIGQFAIAGGQGYGIGGSPASAGLTVGVTTCSGAQLNSVYGVNSGTWYFSAINGTPTGTWLFVGWFITQSTTISPQTALIWQRIS